MIPYKGRRCDIKQYMKKKSVKYGIKVWCATSSKTRYVYNLIVCEGRKNQAAKRDLGERVIVQLVSDLFNEGHVVVTDRFFSSPRLADILMRNGTWFTGTVMHNRKGLPSRLSSYTCMDLERGSLVVAMHRSRRMATIVWFDGCPVFLLSTSSDPMAAHCTVPRWIGSFRSLFPTSPIQVEYHCIKSICEASIL